MEITRNKAIVAAIALSLEGIAVGIGISYFLDFGPERVITEEKLKVVEVEKQVVVEKEVVRVEVVRVKDTQVVDRWRREKTETQMPDGTLTKKEVEERNIDTVVKEKETKAEVRVVEVEKQVVVEREKLVETKTTPVLPNWHISVLGGVAPRFDQPPLTPVMVGVEVERRAIGPFFAGGWVMGGSPVVGPFTLTNASFGIKIGAEF